MNRPSCLRHAALNSVVLFNLIGAVTIAEV